MKFFFAFFLIAAVVSVEVNAQCDFNECDSGCRSRGNFLGRCISDNVCQCVVVVHNKCDSNECDTGCRSRGNSYGHCKSDSLCECVVVKS